MEVSPWSTNSNEKLPMVEPARTHSLDVDKHLSTPITQKIDKSSKRISKKKLKPLNRNIPHWIENSSF